MSNITKTVFSVAISLAGLSSFSERASAQFIYRNPYTGQAAMYGYQQQSYFRLSGYNPISGQSYYFQSSQYSSGIVPPAYVAPMVTPYGYGSPAYGYSPYVMGGYGTGVNNPATNPVLQEQARMLRGAAGGNVTDVEARKMIVDQWAFELSGKAPDAGATNKQKNKDPGVQNLLNPPDDKILSGVVLNDLVTAITDKAPKGGKGDGAFLPCDMMSRLEFEGSAAADAMGLLKTGKLEFPEILGTKEYAAVREDLDKCAAAVVEMMIAGKRDASVTEKLYQAVRIARNATARTMREVPLPSATSLARFYVRLEQLARTASESSMQGVYVPKWYTIGVSVYDLTSQMHRYKLKFGPAEVGDENAYFALHRGLSAYYADLLAKK